MRPISTRCIASDGNASKAGKVDIAAVGFTLAAVDPLQTP